MKSNYNFKTGTVIKGKIKSKKQVDKAIGEQQKILTSIRLDKDLVEEAKKRASAEGVGYLTWLNKKLRNSIFNEQSLEKRVEELEKIVLKKNAI